VDTFDEFWPFYLREHAKPLTRRLHMVGTSTALVMAATGVATGQWPLIAAAPVVGYAFSWTGHFFVEHNKPATFKHPLWSFAADFKMLALGLSGRLAPELARAGVAVTASA
jgi:hypothetical protein